MDLLIAFGSAVRGLRRPDSDLDLAVWMTTANMTPQALVALEVALRPLFPGECLDIVLLNRASPLLQFQVAQHGAVLFEAHLVSFTPSRYWHINGMLTLSICAGWIACAWIAF